jgi:hypothetical protein
MWLKKQKIERSNLVTPYYVQSRMSSSVCFITLSEICLPLRNPVCSSDIS